MVLRICSGVEEEPGNVVGLLFSDKGSTGVDDDGASSGVRLEKALGGEAELCTSLCCDDADGGTTRGGGGETVPRWSLLLRSATLLIRVSSLAWVSPNDRVSGCTAPCCRSRVVNPG